MQEFTTVTFEPPDYFDLYAEFEPSVEGKDINDAIAAIKENYPYVEAIEVVYKGYPAIAIWRKDLKVLYSRHDLNEKKVVEWVKPFDYYDFMNCGNLVSAKLFYSSYSENQNYKNE